MAKGRGLSVKACYSPRRRSLRKWNAARTHRDGAEQRRDQHPQQSARFFSRHQSGVPAWQLGRPVASGMDAPIVKHFEQIDVAKRLLQYSTLAPSRSAALRATVIAGGEYDG